jgi:protein-tyrosine-phosphatase
MMMTEKKTSILFVCTGNTCRSPMAEVLLLREWRGRPGVPALDVASAGLAAVDGEKASEHARAVMREAGIDLEMHASALLDEELVGEASLILVMSRQHREQLLRRFPAAAAKTFLLKEFAGIAGNPDVADPYGGTIEEYRQIYEELRAGIKKIVQILERSKDNEDSLGQ